VTYDDGESRWEPEIEIILLNQTIADRSKPRKDVEYSQKKRKSELSSSESSEDDSSNSENGSVNGEKTKRTTRVRARNISYFEWPDSSSGEDSPDSNYIKIRESKKPKKSRKTNYTAIEPFLATKKTAILYSDICLKHFVPKWHLERPSRISQVMEGVKTIFKHFPNNMDIVTDVKPVSRQILVQVHDDQYITKMESQKPSSDVPQHATQFSLDDRETQDCDTFMSYFSWEAALTAAGAVCKAVDLVHNGNYRNAFCVIRPPGHHCGVKGHTAEASSQGYCIINNIAVGAFHAVAAYNYKKIAVVDFDVHHGNGTEEILQNRENFMFVSIHVGEIYPGTGGLDVSRAPNVVNVSLPPGTASHEFRKAFDSQVIPALENYEPEILLLSSGFDGHKRDPTDDGLRLEEADYSYITERLQYVAEKYCNSKIVSVLEGGYHLPSLRKSAKEHVLGLMKKGPGEKPPTVSSPTTATNYTVQVTTQSSSNLIAQFMRTSSSNSVTSPTAVTPTSTNSANTTTTPPNSGDVVVSTAIMEAVGQASQSIDILS